MGMIGTALSGIQVAQLGLLTTEHNISNATTPGFNRQRTMQATNIPLSTGAGFIGQGAHVTTVERQYDSFLQSQINTTQATSSELDTYYSWIKQIDNMLADTNSGVSTALQSFFTGVQKVAANPSLLPSRQAMISSGEALASRYNVLADRIAAMYEGVDERIGNTLGLINTYAEQIASLNGAIIVAKSVNNQSPNDLLDQRENLVSELNKLVKVTTTTNSDGTFNVFIGQGQQLVVGAEVSSLVAMPSEEDPTRISVWLRSGGGRQELPESLITGGALGGMLSFRSGSLDRVANDLGRNAASLALTFNSQHALGQDLLGNVVGNTGFQADFFGIGQPAVISNSRNGAGAPDVQISFTPPEFDGNFYTNLTNSDYRLESLAGGLQLTRVSDGFTWPTAPALAADLDELNTLLGTSQGFNFTNGGAALPAIPVGMSYRVQPTRTAALSLTVNDAIAADGRLIAAAAPIRTQASSTNTGTATISAGSVATGYSFPTVPAPAPDDAPITLTYHAPVAPATQGTFDWDATGAVAAGSVAYTSGETITINGVSIDIKGSPNEGDVFLISRNTAAVSDGRNALLLGQLQSQSTMSGKTASYQSAYAQFVSDNGNKTREIQVKNAAQTALLKQSNDSRDALSGVNLDEEAANLMRYQQAYQASAKMLEVGGKLFDLLLSLGS